MSPRRPRSRAICRWSCAASACDRGALGLQGVGLAAERGGLLLETRLLGLERRALLLQLGALRLQGGRLRLALGLLRFELVLKLLRLVLLRLHRRVHLRGRVEVDADQQRPVVAHAEALGEQVVGLALGGVGRRRADVLLPELEGEDRDQQHAEQDQRDDDRPPRVHGQERAPPRPQAGAGRLLLGTQEGGQLEGVDARPDEGEQRRQQGDRGQHRREHGHRGRVAERGDQGDARHGERQEGDHHRAAREHDRAAGGGHREGDRLVHLDALVHLAPVAVDQEQRVVDPHAEADHRGEGGRDVGHPDHVAHQADAHQPDDQADHGRDDRHAHRHDRPEREAQDEHRQHDADQLAALGRGLRELAADRAARGDVGDPGRSQRT